MTAAPGDQRRNSPAEEARTIVAGADTATLATVAGDGAPWASLVGFGLLPGGDPVVLVSSLAEHGRNLRSDPRASLCAVEAAVPGGDPLDAGRVTLAGACEPPADGDARASALTAFRASHPAAATYAGFGDFSLLVLRVERVRWVGGYGRMGSVAPAAYAAAEPDPVAPAPSAVEHLNHDHPDALLSMARALGGMPDAERARCTRADRHGLDLWVDTPRGPAPARVAFAEPCAEPGGLRAATVELARRSRALGA